MVAVWRQAVEGLRAPLLLSLSAHNTETEETGADDNKPSVLHAFVFCQRLIDPRGFTCFRTLSATTQTTVPNGGQNESLKSVPWGCLTTTQTTVPSRSQKERAYSQFL